jgi:hypothetical protein
VSIDPNSLHRVLLAQVPLGHMDISYATLMTSFYQRAAR